MPASAATTGRAAASLRAAIALSAEVSVSTIHSHADLAPAPSANSRQWPWSCPPGRPHRPGSRPDRDQPVLRGLDPAEDLFDLYERFSTALRDKRRGNEGNLTSHVYADLRFSRLSTHWSPSCCIGADLRFSRLARTFPQVRACVRSTPECQCRMSCCGTVARNRPGNGAATPLREQGSRQYLSTP